MNVDIKPLTEAEKKALQLKSVVGLPAYIDTIGAWLLEEKAKAIALMSEGAEPHQVHRSQGAYAVITSLLDRIEATLSRANVAKRKRQKILTKK